MTKRVLFVDHDPGWTGTSVSMEYLIDGFLSWPAEVWVLTSKRGPDARRLLAKGVRLISFRQWRYLPVSLSSHFTNERSAFSLGGALLFLRDVLVLGWGVLLATRAILKVKPDLVYVNEHVVVSASVAALLLDVPSVMHVRSRILTGRWGIRHRLFSWLVTSTNAALFPISRIEGEQLGASPEVKKKVFVTGEFVPMDRLPDIARHASKLGFGLAPERRIVTMLGGISTIKGSLEFLRAAELVHEMDGTVFFVIAGKIHDSSLADRRNYELCLPLINRLENRKALRVVGEVDNPLELIALSDIVVSSSTSSHFSRPAVEAWGLSKPVVASATTHMSDLISHGNTGLLYPPGDFWELASCLKQLLADPGFMGRLALEGNKNAEQHFNADTNVRLILSHCDDILGKR